MWSALMRLKKKHPKPINTVMKFPKRCVRIKLRNENGLNYLPHMVVFLGKINKCYVSIPNKMLIS